MRTIYVLAFEFLEQQMFPLHVSVTLFKGANHDVDVDTDTKPGQPWTNSMQTPNMSIQYLLSSKRTCTKRSEPEQSAPKMNLPSNCVSKDFRPWPKQTKSKPLSCLCMPTGLPDRILHNLLYAMCTKRAKQIARIEISFKSKRKQRSQQDRCKTKQNNATQQEKY